ncbi:MAG: tetratricopeptide repeat protein [Polyangiales bacterium]
MSEDNVIHVDFGRRGKRARPPASSLRSEDPAPQVLDPGNPRRLLPAPASEPPAALRTKDPLADVYTARDAAKLFGLSPSRLRYWERSGFIGRSVSLEDQRYYSFEDLIGIRAAKELLDEGVALQSVRKSVAALRASLPRVARPLSSLRIVVDGQTLLVRDDQGSYEPTTGQLRLDFEVSELRDDVVRVLRRSGRQNDFALAYQHYLEGCRFDEDPTGFERAEAAYRRAIELDPSLANAVTNLGNLSYRRGRLEEAQNLYVRALQIDPEQPEAFYNLGFLLYDRGELAAAVLNFRRALRSDPAFADAHFNLAMALSDLGQGREAREHWETYLRLDPESPWAEIARQHLK